MKKKDIARIEKHLNFHDGQVPFILHADFENILEPIDEQHCVKINKMKKREERQYTYRKGKTHKEKAYTEKINTHVPSRWCLTSTFVYGDVPDSLKIYCGKGCLPNFLEHIEDQVKHLYAVFPQ